MSPKLDNRSSQNSAHQKQTVMKSFQDKDYQKIEEKNELAGLVNISKNRSGKLYPKRRSEQMQVGSKHKGE